MELKGLIRVLLNLTKEHNNFKIIEDRVMEEVTHGMEILSHNASFMENLDTLSKKVTIDFTQISLGLQIG